MPLSTEVFVMVIFIVGCPFFYFMLRDSDLRGRKFFKLAYVLLTLSNIFTVVEEFWLYSLFNTCEHLCITIASIMMLVAVIKLTATNTPRSISQISDNLKG